MNELTLTTSRLALVEQAKNNITKVTHFGNEAEITSAALKVYRGRSDWG
jgi:hypothetical protein